MDKYYKISKKALLELLKAQEDIDALMCMGVDSWAGYGECDWASDAEIESFLLRYKEV